MRISPAINWLLLCRHMISIHMGNTARTTGMAIKPQLSSHEERTVMSGGCSGSAHPDTLVQGCRIATVVVHSLPSAVCMMKRVATFTCSSFGTIAHHKC